MSKAQSDTQEKVGTLESAHFPEIEEDQSKMMSKSNLKITSRRLAQEHFDTSRGT